MNLAGWLCVTLLLTGCSLRHAIEDTSEPSDTELSADGELCDNGLDDDGDGQVDEGCPCVPGDQQDCYAGLPGDAGVGECGWGLQTCNADGDVGSWGDCYGWTAPSDEACDGADNDCDGEIDPGCACMPGDREVCYGGPVGTANVGACRTGFYNCVETATGSAWTACEDWVGPSIEVCDNGLDEDCDTLIDEGCACDLGDTQPCYGAPDATLDVGECRAGEQTCISDGQGDVRWSACEDAVLPGIEICTGGDDEDCDGFVDCDDPDCEAACCEAYDESVAVVPAEGDLMFVVDRSGSMDWLAAGTTRTRWQELLSAMNVAVPQVADMHLGLLTFPLMNGTSEALWCGVAGTPDVGLGLGTGSAILQRLVVADPRAGDTPTPQAFATCQTYLDANPSSRERFVILATDGLPEPNCGSTVSATVAAISALRADGVDTFVLGIVGPSSSGDTSGIPALQAGLNDMADAGGRARTGAIRYYEANDGPALTSALESILASATNCEFTLSAPPPGPVQVRFGGSVVPASGYQIIGTRLVFTGSYCAQIQSGVVATIRVLDTCP